MNEEKTTDEQSEKPEFVQTPGAGKDCKIETDRLGRYRNYFRRNREKLITDEVTSFRTWMRADEERALLFAAAKVNANPTKAERPKTYVRGNPDNPGANKKKVKNKNKKKKAKPEEE